MELALVTVAGINFVFTIVIMVTMVSVSGALRSQSMQAIYLKNQLTFLYERIGEIAEKAEKNRESVHQELETLKTELQDILKQGRQDTMRENDDIKFLARQIQKAVSPGDVRR